MGYQGFVTEAAEAPEIVAAPNRTRKDGLATAVYTTARDLCIGSRYAISDKYLFLSVEH